MAERISLSESSTRILSWEAKSFAHVATVGPSGEPHSSPVWFEWDGTLLRISLYDDAQKLKNLRRDPRVSISVMDPTDDYRFVEMRGVAEAFEADPDGAFLTRMSEKYLGLDHFPWPQEGKMEVVVTIRPTRVIGPS